MRSSEGPSLDVSHVELATVAATMTSAARSLATLAATRPIHAPLAADEVSTSAAARLTEHGSVLSSRATDGAAVLAAAAQAVLALSNNLAEIDLANAAALTLGCPAAGPVSGPVTPAAVKVNAAAADTSIAPMAPRSGELTAGLIESGSSGTGATFNTTCGAYESAFETSAVAARKAEGAVAAGITGRTGPRLSSALSKFASWADAMASHSATLAQAARDHGGRFEHTQHDTPSTQQFTDTRGSLTRAQMLNLQTGGMAAGLVAQYQGQLQRLDSTATAAGVAYHFSELPQAPPLPPAVTDIVDDGSSTSNDGAVRPGERKPVHSRRDNQSGVSTDASGSASDLNASGGASGSDGNPLRDTATDPLLAGEAGTSPMGGDAAQQIAPMVTMLPAALAGALGGALGAVASVPQQVGQQVLGAAQQIMQGAASSRDQPQDLGLDTEPSRDVSLSDHGGGGLTSGGGGGGTEPAGMDTSLPPSGGGALAAASAPPGGPALPASTGALSAPAQTAPAGPGMGGTMMPPMVGGMGGTGGAGNASRTPSQPNKTVIIPSIPNGEPVKGEVERRQTASVDDPATTSAQSGDPPPGRPRRRVVMSAPIDLEGEAKP